jgi:hypothetical protein
LEVFVVFLIGLLLGFIFGIAGLVVFSFETTDALPEDLRREFDALALRAQLRCEDEKHPKK